MAKQMHETLRRALKQARADGHTRATFADQVLEVSRWTFWRIETGRRAAKYYELQRAKRYLEGRR